MFAADYSAEVTQDGGFAAHGSACYEKSSEIIGKYRLFKGVGGAFYLSGDADVYAADVFYRIYAFVVKDGAAAKAGSVSTFQGDVAFTQLTLVAVEGVVTETFYAVGYFFCGDLAVKGKSAVHGFKNYGLSCSQAYFADV